MKLFFTRKAVVLYAQSLFVILFFSLLFPCKSLAQARAGKVIRLSSPNITIARIISEVQSQTDYTFSYVKQYADLGKTVALGQTSCTIDELIPELIAQTGLSFWRKGNTIIVREKKKGIVKGSVQTSDGKPAGGVTVQLQGTGFGAVTKGDGSYALNAPEGNYVLAVSFTGLQTQTQNITVTNSKTVTADFTLAENNEQLQDVLVSAATNKFANKASEDIAKMPLSDMENPQVVSVVNNSLINAQMLTNFRDAMKDATGVTSTGQDGLYSVRGFVTGPNMRNGLATLSTTSDIDIANVEKIEVLKGPAGTLFGSPQTSYGGMINKVTKQPYGHLGGEVDYTIGSFGLSRLTADINAPVTKDSTFMFRMNAAHTSQESFQDFGYSKSNFFAPVFLYKPNDRLTVSLEAEFSQSESTTPTYVFFGSNGLKDYQYMLDNYKRSFTKNDIASTYPVTNIYGKINYKLSRNWTSQTLLSYNRAERSGSWAMRYFEGQNDDSMRRAVVDYKNYYSRTIEIQQNFISDYQWGKLRNRLVTGLDFYSYNVNEDFYLMSYDTLNLSNLGQEYLNFNKSNVLAYEQNSDTRVMPYIVQDESYVYAAYASDIFNITDNLIINAALRIDHFDNKGSYDPVAGTWSGGYNQTSLSPKFGIVWQPVKNIVSLFANYTDGFENQTGQTFNGAPFKPSHGKQAEAGIKADAWQHRISATASYYYIHATGLLEPDLEHANYSVQDATQTSKGVELDLSVAPLDGLNIFGGYGYNKKTMEEGDNSYAPRNTANLFASYQFVRGGIKGLGISFGGNYTDANRSTQGGNFVIPGYTVINSSVFLDKKHYRLGVRLDNITNKKYFLSFFDLEPQMPRNVSATLAIKF